MHRPCDVAQNAMRPTSLNLSFGSDVNVRRLSELCETLRLCAKNCTRRKDAKSRKARKEDLINHFTCGTNLASSTNTLSLTSENFMTDPKGGRDHVIVNGSFTPPASW